MFIAYCLKQFYKTFILMFAVLVLVFAAADLIIRLSTLPTLSFVPTIVLSMMPLVSLFVLPLASSISLQLAVGSWLKSGAYLMIAFLSPARRTLLGAVAIFSCSLLLLYIPLIFYWAPASYFRAKKIIVEFAKEQLKELEAGVFHYPTSSLAIFFEKKFRAQQGGMQFEHLILKMHQGEGSYVITARSGRLCGSSLLLEHGTMQNRAQEKSYVGNFEQTTINIDELMHARPYAEHELAKIRVDTKFLTLPELWSIRAQNGKASAELHARILKIIWQLLVPFFAVVASLRWGVLHQTNTRLSIGFSSALFFASYVVVGSAQLFWKVHWQLLLAMYGSSFLFFIILSTILFRSRRSL